MTHSVIDNAVTLKVFSAVAEARNLVLREILELCYPEEVGREEARSEILDNLGELVKEGLIRKEKAPIEDFNVYYITTQGLRAYRKLRRSGVLEESGKAFRFMTT